MGTITSRSTLSPVSRGTKFSWVICHIILPRMPSSISSNVLRVVGCSARRASYQIADELSSIRLLTDKKSNQSRGCAFVEFSGPGAMKKALAMTGSELNGRKWALVREESGPAS